MSDWVPLNIPSETDGVSRLVTEKAGFTPRELHDPIGLPPIPDLRGKLTPLGDQAAIIRHRQRIMDGLNEGIDCPCCGGHARLYPRKFASLTAVTLIRAYRDHGIGQSFHLPTLLKKYRYDNADQAKARFWGLIEAVDGEKPDGNPRSGWWVLTPKCEDFIMERITIPRVALVYRRECHGFEGPEIDIHEALTEDFHYGELMGLV